MRRHSCRSALLVYVVVVATAAHAATGPRTKPVYEQETLHAVPSSFGSLWEQADIVAKVKVLRSEVQPVGGAAVPRIRTVHHASVIKIYKGAHSPGAQVDFSQVAGELETPDYIVRVTDETPLCQGEYVVFLKRGQQAGSLFLVGDLEGAYKINNGYVEPQGKLTSFAKELRGLSEARFAEEMEAARRHAAETKR